MNPTTLLENTKFNLIPTKPTSVAPSEFQNEILYSKKKGLTKGSLRAQRRMSGNEMETEMSS